MSSRRLLKHGIHVIANDLISECLLIVTYVPNASMEKTQDIIHKIAHYEDEFVTRAARYDGKNNPKIAKAYYRKLMIDWSTIVNNLSKGIAELSK